MRTWHRILDNNDNVRLQPKSRVIVTALLIAILITIFMRIWPLAAEFMFSDDEMKRIIEMHESGISGGEDSGGEDTHFISHLNQEKDKYYVTAQFIGYSMLIDIILVIMGFLGCKRLNIMFLLTAFFVNVVSICFSAHMLYPDRENAMLTIMIYCPIFCLQAASATSLGFLMVTLKQDEYDQWFASRSI